MIRAKFSPRAESDLNSICDYISADRPESASRVRESILKTADLLAQHQLLGRRIRGAGPRHKQIRWFVVPSFRNYLIFYQPFEQTVVVVRVLHASQDWMRIFRNDPE
jgi:toxin ParE1/3/4